MTGSEAPPRLYRASPWLVDDWDRWWLRWILHLELDHGAVPDLDPEGLRVWHDRLHAVARYGPMGDHDLDDLPEMTARRGPAVPTVWS